MNTFKLTGHSGCALKVEKHGDTYVVIKTAKDKAYGSRLERQALKQREFTHDMFRAPRVLDSRYTKDGLYEFSMEYINGFTLAEHLRRVSVADIPTIAEQFLTLIPAESGFDKDAKAVYQTKIVDLRTATSAHTSTRDAFKRLDAHPWEYVMRSYCHGDLTLENIIWQEGDYYLIDFLDSFHDSWMQDFGKLLFDLESLWSYRHSNVDENLRTRLSIFKSVLLDKLRALTYGDELVREIYHLALLHALRIVPYTHDKDTLSYLLATTTKLQDAIDSL